MTMPNFLIIGAMRSGTSALYSLLSGHPDIFMSSVKEPNFFAFEGQNRPPPVEGSGSITNHDDYRELFSGVTTERRIGEASHSYLYYPSAAKNIRRHVPGAKLICILREPGQRAYSHYLLHKRSGRETLDFRSALAAEDSRVQEGSQFGHYVRRGLYAEQLARFFGVFDPKQIKVLSYDDLQNDPAGVVQAILRFLDISDKYWPDTSVRRNPSGIPRSKVLNGLFTGSNTLKRVIQPVLPPALYRFATRIRDANLVQPEMEVAIRSQLRERFRDDLSSVQDIIDRDLSGWLT